MVLKFALNVEGIPSPVEVSGPPVVDNPSLPGNPLGPTGPEGLFLLGVWLVYCECVEGS